MQETGSFNIEFSSLFFVVTFVDVSGVGEALLIVETVVELLHNLEVGEREICSGLKGIDDLSSEGSTACTSS